MTKKTINDLTRDDMMARRLAGQSYGKIALDYGCSETSARDLAHAWGIADIAPDCPSSLSARTIDQAAFRAAFDAGATDEELCRKFGKTPHTIRSLRHEFRLFRHGQKTAKETRAEARKRTAEENKRDIEWLDKIRRESKDKGVWVPSAASGHGNWS